MGSLSATRYAPVRRRAAQRAGAPLVWEIPELRGFNYQGGLRLPPAFLALLVALTIYHSAHMAEAVRAGILSVSRGQTEAATRSD